MTRIKLHSTHQQGKAPLSKDGLNLTHLPMRQLTQTLASRNNGCHFGTVPLTPITGRIVLAAGSFGTAEVLFRSGIGPNDQVEVVKSSTDGATMIESSFWINIPVGYNLDDHINTDTVISHPDISYYIWPAA